MNSNFMIPEFPHSIRIRLARLKFFCCTLMLLSLCPVGCLSSAFLNWGSQQGRDLAMSGSKKNQLCQSYSYVMRKVWYHQIWIQKNLGFIVLIPNVHDGSFYFLQATYSVPVIFVYILLQHVKTLEHNVCVLCNH